MGIARKERTRNKLTFRILTLVMAIGLATTQDPTQSQISNFQNQLSAVYLNIYDNYYLLQNLASEMQRFSYTIGDLNQQIGQLQTVLKEVEMGMVKINKTNQYWVKNFKIMGNAFEQLKKKHQVKSDPIST